MTPSESGAPAAVPTSSSHLHQPNSLTTSTSPFAGNEKALQVMKSCLQQALKDFPNVAASTRKRKKRPLPGDIPPWKIVAPSRTSSIAFSESVVPATARPGVSDKENVPDRNNRNEPTRPPRTRSQMSTRLQTKSSSVSEHVGESTDGSSMRKRLRGDAAKSETVEELLFGEDESSLSDVDSVYSTSAPKEDREQLPSSKLPTRPSRSCNESVRAARSNRSPDEWETLLLTEEAEHSAFKAEVPATPQKLPEAGPQEEWEKLLFDGEISPAKSEYWMSDREDSPAPMRRLTAFEKQKQKLLDKNRAVCCLRLDLDIYHGFSLCMMTMWMPHWTT